MSELDRLNAAEIIFMVYALGFTLEKVAAMQEHGIRGQIKRLTTITEDSLMYDDSIFQRHMG